MYKKTKISTILSMSFLRKKTMGKMFCPRCRSFNVKKEINASLALGVPQRWVCVDCGYSNYIFPELNKENKTKTKHG